jgi:hypothetical protein
LLNFSKDGTLSSASCKSFNHSIVKIKGSTKHVRYIHDHINHTGRKLTEKILFQARHDVVPLDSEVSANVFTILQPKRLSVTGTNNNEE